MEAIVNGEKLEYKIVCAKWDVFCAELKELLESGFELHAGPSATIFPNGVEPCYTQALVRRQRLDQWSAKQLCDN